MSEITKKSTFCICGNSDGNGDGGGGGTTVNSDGFELREMSNNNQAKRTMRNFANGTVDGGVANNNDENSLRFVLEQFLESRSLLTFSMEDLSSDDLSSISTKTDLDDSSDSNFRWKWNIQRKNYYYESSEREEDTSSNSNSSSLVISDTTDLHATTVSSSSSPLQSDYESASTSISSQNSSSYDCDCSACSSFSTTDLYSTTDESYSDFLSHVEETVSLSPCSTDQSIEEQLSYDKDMKFICEE